MYVVGGFQNALPESEVARSVTLASICSRSVSVSGGSGLGLPPGPTTTTPDGSTVERPTAYCGRVSTFKPVS